MLGTIVHTQSQSPEITLKLSPAQVAEIVRLIDRAAPTTSGSPPLLSFAHLIRQGWVVSRRGAATSAVKAIAEFGQDNLETDGNEIDTNVLVAIVECLPVPLRKLGGASLSAFRAIEAFGPMVPPGHSPNMRLRQA